jgi:hypothetical protein
MWVNSDHAIKCALIFEVLWGDLMAAGLLSQGENYLYLLRGSVGTLSIDLTRVWALEEKMDLCWNF